MSPGRGGRSRSGRLIGAVSLLAAGLAAAGCDTRQGDPRFDFERMIRQDRLDAYEASELFPDGKAMRAPPEGVVVHDTAAPPRHVRTGLRDGEWVEELPGPSTLERLERGRERFDVYCAPCHGYDGNALTPVAGAMTLKRPPSLHATRVREHPDGRLYAIVRRGFGLMPGYGDQLPVDDRWAVVAYVRTLQLSREVDLDALPDDVARELRDRLPEEGGGGAGDGVGAGPAPRGGRGP